MKRTMLIAALAAILCCAALPGMAQDYSEYWFDGAFVEKSAGATDLNVDSGTFGFGEKALGRFWFSAYTKGPYGPVDGMKLWDYTGKLQFWDFEGTKLWEGEFFAPVKENKFFFTAAVVDGADNTPIHVEPVEVAGVKFGGATDYFRVAEMSVVKSDAKMAWDAPLMKGFAFQVEKFDSMEIPQVTKMTGYVQLAAPPPSIPEPVFFQFGAMMGLSGLGILRLRRKA